MADSSTSNKGAAVIGVAAGLGLLAAIFGSKKPKPAFGAPARPKLGKGCNCGR